MQKISVFWTAIVLLVIAIFLLFILSIYVKQQQKLSNAAVEPTYLTKVLAIDMDATAQTENFMRFQNGDAILILHPLGEPTHERDLLATYVLLHNLDVDNNRRIDQKDPAYLLFELLFYDQNSKLFRYETVQKAGIRAIYLGQPDWGWLPRADKNQPPQVIYPHATAIMADSSTRMIREVGVSFLP